MLDKREFYIDGQWVPPKKANDFDVIDPSTENAVGVISLGGQADTDAAVAAAGRAFEGWSASSKDARSSRWVRSSVSCAGRRTCRKNRR